MNLKNNIVRERNHPELKNSYDFIVYEMFRMDKFIEKESRLVVFRALG